MALDSKSLVDLYFGQLSIYQASKKRELDAPILAFKYVYRPLSFFFSSIFLKLGLSANQVSVGNLISLLLAAFFFLSGTAVGVSLGTAFFLLFYIIDFADGNIARYRGASSFLGKFIDGFIDVVGKLIFIPMAIGAKDLGSSGPFGDIILLAGIGYPISFLLFEYFKLRLEYYLIQSRGREVGSVSVAISRSGILKRIKQIYVNAGEALPIVLLVVSFGGMVGQIVVGWSIVYFMFGVSDCVLAFARGRVDLTVPRSI